MAILKILFSKWTHPQKLKISNKRILMIVLLEYIDLLISEHSHI